MAEIATNTDDDRRRQLLADEKRPLFDMHLNIGQHRCGIDQRFAAAHPRHVDTDGFHMGIQGQTVAPVDSQAFGLVKLAEQGLRRDVAGPEPGAFLATHRQDLDRTGEMHAVAACPHQTKQTGDDARQPVEVAASRHGIDVRADQDIFPGGGVLGQGKHRIPAGVVRNRQPLVAGEFLKIGQGRGFNLGIGGAADSFDVGGTFGDVTEQAIGDCGELGGAGIVEVKE